MCTKKNYILKPSNYKLHQDLKSLGPDCDESKWVCITRKVMYRKFMEGKEYYVFHDFVKAHMIYIIIMSNPLGKYG